jgi:LmbE family N-acetylglucosaminyl deacetylase
MTSTTAPPTGKNVLLVMAHPDDAELSSAGTVLILIEQGYEVRYVVCSTGDKGTKDTAMTPLQLAAIREQEQKEAAAVLGVQRITFLRHPDGELDRITGLRDEIALLIRNNRPDIIITHDPWRPYQIHPDHRAVGFAAADAVVYARDHLFLPALLELDLVPHAPLEIYFTFPASADHVVDISAVMEKKLDAIAKHKSQLTQMPGWRENIKLMASKQAEGQPFTYAEAFKRLVLTHRE